MLNPDFSSGFFYGLFFFHNFMKKTGGPAQSLGTTLH
jgi:hypothetical protein